MKNKLFKKSASDFIATFFNQFWRLISGSLLLLLLPIFLTETQQGYWYLFSSIAALSTFADLGFSTIILQFSAHEYSSLNLNENSILIGAEQQIKKIGSFFRFVVQWLVKMCSFVFPVVFFIGLFFFVRDDVVGEYIVPWTIYSIGTFVNFFNNSILSFVEGLDQIKKIQQSRLTVSVINSLVIILCLCLQLSIYALALAMLISSSFMFITIFRTFGFVIKQLWTTSSNFSFPWKEEILPLFKKYIVSFTSGYFLFQIYTPLMHLFHGPIYSGKVGFSLTLINTIVTFSSIWMYIVTPQINILIARKQWFNLDKIFNKRLFLCIITYIGIIFVFIMFVLLLGKYSIVQIILGRLLPMKGLLILIFAYFFQLCINNWAVYLRGHKIEPYCFVSVFSAIWVFIITVIVGKFFSPDVFFLGLLSSYIWGLPWSYVIFMRYKKSYHIG